MVSETVRISPTTLRFVLPRLQPRVSHAAQARIFAPQPLARILVSDDTPAIEQIYTHLLPRHGFEVIAVPDGSGAHTVELTQRYLPDLVITDVNKPGLNGYAVCAAIRNSPRTAHIPVVVVTAMDEWLDRRHSINAGVTDHIVKPIAFEQLLYRLAVLLPLTRHEQARLIDLTLRIPGAEFYHPITGIIGPQALARALPELTTASEWAALTFSVSHLAQLARFQGRILADDLLLRLAVTLRAAIDAVDKDSVFLAHTDYDWRISLFGSPTSLDQVVDLVRHRFTSLVQRRLQPADLARGYLRYRTADAVEHQVPIPALHVQRLDNRNGPLANLLSFWERLDYVSPHLQPAAARSTSLPS